MPLASGRRLFPDPLVDPIRDQLRRLVDRPAARLAWILRVVRHAHRRAERLDRQDLVDDGAVGAVQTHTLSVPRPVVRLLRDRECKWLLGAGRLPALLVAAPHPAAAAARIEAENPAVVLFDD